MPRIQKICTTCHFEPKWRPVAGEKFLQGTCGNGLHSRVPSCCFKAIIIWRQADGRKPDKVYAKTPRNQYKSITNCPAWWAKD